MLLSGVPVKGYRLGFQPTRKRENIMRIALTELQLSVVLVA
nr:MAG TPA: hypothetical protein [Caudoviricetes sp.]